ncbi:outer membrane protein assembly factor BamA [Phocoenobacter skyensis]|uniref:Outer membrane protein assembly factor BamA n=1 Tax=Phocoenobacter skyensis TaxID=97481 RepID=A0A1H7U1T1_9PAST|nr:outer membrane protein assembly factor BamA [Pasteurella skyensis]MDP8078708.1 outer membrane protein assembly factor BamA [Pasteurella skyensis]MDP8084702.1 outer membrane protein assembly factor BamA [Pasteurella skyensis]MDP8170235.1 outer membrane protein assembly factor BamA [Pasteurella skyensis]MDP8174490.1 outer membrane protein assembly factor BamA [Pasteurella skyensis]MDP8184152.1 outer membrane protein assembly factor BamA [Pasteurella skyensis]
MKKLLLSSILLANGVIAAPFVVKDIRIDGVSPEAQNSIISTLPVKIGQRATDRDITYIVQQLFVQKRFTNVSARREGNVLVVDVVERPLIADIKIEGNKAVPKAALQDNLKANLIAKGEFYDALKLKEFKQGLLDHYHSVGRYNATIDTIITPLSDGQIDIKLKISENDVAYVKEIHFEGNKAFDEDDLIDKLDIQPNVSWWNIFESSKFEQQAFKKDLDTLRNFYLNNGYVKFAINDVKTDFSDDKKEVKLTYKITEGKQYKVSGVRVIGDTANLDKELNKIVAEFETGDLFRGKDLDDLKGKIENRLGKSGYGSAKVQLSLAFDEKKDTVKVTYITEAGKRLYVRHIRFEGNDVTADSTLRREMRQQEGAWLSTSALSTGKARLERTGFYESVEMKTVAVPNTTDQVDVIYSIKERNTGSVNFGISYGTGSGFGYQAGIQQDNFLGMGSSISLNGVRNKYSTTFKIGYNEPYFTKDGVSLGGELYYSNYDYSKVSSSSAYKRTTLGLDGTLGFPVDEYNSYYLGLGVVNDKIQNVQREWTRQKYVSSMDIKYEPNALYFDKIKTTDFNFSFGWNYNSLDRGFMPTEGLRASLGGNVTVPGSDNKYYKLSSNFAYYYPLNREHKWVISTRLKFGYASGFGGKELPFFQTYNAGGIGSVRGFSFGTIGPNAIYLNKKGEWQPAGDVIGGNAKAIANLELIMPTPFVAEKYQHKVRTTLFVDAGTVWNTKWEPMAGWKGIDYGDYKRFRASVGLGLQWNSPIGPLLLSYAKPLRKHPEDNIEQFQFSIGGSF